MRRIEDLPDAHLRVFDRPALPDAEAFEDVYLIGICGTGMGSLAGLFHQAGYRVRGSDAAAWPPMSTRLGELGIPVLEGFDADHLDPPPGLVVVGNACTPTHVEAARARESSLAQASLPEAIAQYFIRDRVSLVVAGTHGKTTTTSLLVHVLRTAGLDPGFLVGGVMRNGDMSYGIGAGAHFVIEGDEYDSAYFDKRPKFLHYRPTHAVVTSLEFDHADIYDTWNDYRDAFREFARTVNPAGSLVLNADDPEVRTLARHTGARVVTYGLAAADLDVTAGGVSSEGDGQRFTLVRRGTDLGTFFLPMSGRHNLSNALAVCAVALGEGVTPRALREGLATFAGIRRRQEIRGEVDRVTVLDDFAHHPTAVRATIDAVRERWPERRLVAVFEPRSNSSRRKVFEEGYMGAFDRADAVFLSTPPFRHNDRAEDFMDIGRVTASLERRGIHTGLGRDADELLPALLDWIRPGDVVLVMSNGGFGNIHARLLAALAERAPA
jgi:UDP-N-acetylmuramate: L-alanyl-gamma-D-glutamyl-meso-diaminopimelate ligase